MVYNVNEGVGCSLLEKSPTLAQYSQLVSLVREYWGRGPITHHQRQQIYDICMEEGILVDFMKEYGKTIIDMLRVEFTEAEIQQLFEAMERVNKLNVILRNTDRMDDLFESMEDPTYQQQLFEEFGL